MYSLEDRIRAVELYPKYDRTSAAVGKEGFSIFHPIFKDFVRAWQSRRSWEALRDGYIRPHEALLQQFYDNFVAAGGPGDMASEYRSYWADKPEQVDEFIRRLEQAPRSLDESICRTADGVLEALGSRSQVDIVALVGLGTTNACQLIHRGTPTVVLALDVWGQHFMDGPLPWEDVPLWLTHELAHVIRYAEGRSGFSEFIVNGALDYNGAIEKLSLLEFLIDEGLATMVARMFGGATDDAHALGFTDAQLAWCRDNESSLRREMKAKLHQPLTMDGYSRYFSYGADDIPPRTGYYVGFRLVEAWCLAVSKRFETKRTGQAGAEDVVARALRMPAEAFV